MQNIAISTINFLAPALNRWADIQNPLDNDEIVSMEKHLADMLESSSEFAANIEATHVKRTTVSLAYTVAELGGLSDKRSAKSDS